MKFADGFLAEMDYEMPNTRKYLEIVPEDKFDFTPHEKSGKLLWLASHIADLPKFATRIVEADEYDLKAAPPRPPLPSSVAEMLEKFDRNVAEARQALEGASDEFLAATWRLRAGEMVLFELPRGLCLRVMTFNHMIHHRAQLQVYLRLLDVPLPSLYGPTADAPRKM
ncbi:MAG: DinB family protein [Candidatus Sumerlaeia bacterium]